MNLQSVKFQGLQLVDPNADYSGEQVIYLDFDGEQNVTYNNPALGLTVGDIAVTDSGLTTNQIHTIVENLNTMFADTGVTFTVTKPLDSEEYSTIYVGGTGAAFSEYGNFLGLAETIDAGNRIKTDNAFVFSDKLTSDTALTETITHEAAHLLGFQHANDITLAPDINDFAASYNYIGSVDNIFFVTHGYLPNLGNIISTAPDWLDVMGDSIKNRLGNLNIGDVGKYILSVGTLGVKLSSTTITQKNLVIEIDWSRWADLGIDKISTETIASEISTFLQTYCAGWITNDTNIYAIGHSRGGSLVAALANDFYTNFDSVSIDAAVFLDPHPVVWKGNIIGHIPEIIGDVDYGWNFSLTEGIMSYNSASIDTVYNYYRNDGLLPDDIINPDGWRVQEGNNVYNVKLNDGFFDENTNGGYSSIFNDQHSDVHLWFQGTILTDVTNGFSDGEDDIFVSSTQANRWYSNEAIKELDGLTSYKREDLGFNLLLKPTSISSNNPEISISLNSTTPVRIGENITLKVTATFTQKVEFFLDKNNNGQAEGNEFLGCDYNGSDGWSWTVSTSKAGGWVDGTNNIIAVASGQNGMNAQASGHVRLQKQGAVPDPDPVESINPVGIRETGRLAVGGSKDWTFSLNTASSLCVTVEVSNGTTEVILELFKADDTLMYSAEEMRKNDRTKNNDDFDWQVVLSGDYALSAGNYYLRVSVKDNSPDSDVDEYSISINTGKGSGTEADPWQIYEDDLKKIGTGMYKRSDHYILMEDIPGYNGDFTPLMSEANRGFSGVFDGNNHVIKDFRIVATSSGKAGLFEHIDGGTIKNLGLENISFEEKLPLNKNNGCYDSAGCIAAIMENGIIENCYVITSSQGIMVYAVPNPSIPKSDRELCFGGLVGEASNSKIIESYFNGSASTRWNNESSGGLIGDSRNCIISDCWVGGNLSFDNDDDRGGIFGSGDATVKNCYVSAVLSAGTPYITSGHSSSSGCVNGTPSTSRNDIMALGWDLDNVWDMIDGVTTPVLRDLQWKNTAPVFNEINDIVCHVGETLNITIPGITDPDDTNFYWTASLAYGDNYKNSLPLPSWLSCDYTAGVISGAPVTPESFIMKISAYDGRGGESSQYVMVDITTVPPDLVFTAALTISTSSLMVGDFFAISGTLKNTGMMDTGTSTLAIYRSADGAIATSDTKIAEIPIDAISVGGSRIFTHTISTTGWAPDTYYIGGILDVNNTVNEGTDGEKNNISPGIAITVTSSYDSNLTVNSDLDSHNSVIFDWNDVANAGKYTIEVDNNADFSSPEFADSMSASQAFAILASGTYYWRVRTAGEIWTNGESFSVDGKIAARSFSDDGAATIKSLAALVSGSNVLFDWNSVAGAEKYLIEVDNNPDFSNPEFAASSSTSQTFAILASETYYWRVKPSGSESWTNGESFSITAKIPANHFTDNGAAAIGSTAVSLNGFCALFDWNDVVNAGKYTIEVDNNADFSSPEYGGSSSTSQTFAILASGNYYWRVKTSGSEWTGGQSFSIAGKEKSYKAVEAASGGQLLALNSKNSSLEIYNSIGMSLAQTFSGVSGEDIVLNKSGTVAYVIGKTQVSQFSYSQTGWTKVNSATVGGFLHGGAYDTVNNQLYVCDWQDKASYIFVLDGTSLILKNTITSVNDNHAAVAVSSDGRYIYTGNYYGGSITRLDTANNYAATTLSLGSWTGEMAMAPNGSKLYVLLGTDGRTPTQDTGSNVAVVNLANFSSSGVQYISLPESTYGESQALAVSPNGNLLYVLSTAMTNDAGKDFLRVITISLENYTILNTTDVEKEKLVFSGHNHCISVDSFGNVYVGSENGLLSKVIETSSYPDLVFAATPTVSASSLTIGGSFTISGTLKNTGMMDAGTSTLAIYRSADGAIAISDTKIAEIPIDAISAGGNRIFTHTISTTGWAPDTYYIGGILDVNNTVNEEADGENNNISAGVQITVGAPQYSDLVFGTDIALSKTVLSVGESLVVTGSVRNSGGATAGESTLAIYCSLDSAISVNDTKIKEVPVYTIASGESLSNSITISTEGWGTGIYYLGGILDADDIVDEGTEGEKNNISTGVKITVGGIQAKDDDWKTSPILKATPGASVADEWVGFGDKLDYRKLEVSINGSYDLTLSGLENAAKLTLYSVNAKGTLQSLKSVTITPKFDKAGNVIGNDSGALTGLLLTAGTEYYVLVEATGAASGKNTGYDLTVGGTQFDKANQAVDDDWKTSPVLEATPGTSVTDEWVGFGDKLDFRKLVVDVNGSYNLMLSGLENAAKLTLYTVNAKGTLQSLKSVTITPKFDKAGNVLGNSTGGLTGLLLTAGTEYYVLVEATGAATGKNTSYDLTVDGIQFIRANEAEDNIWNSGYSALAVKFGDSINEWVGFGDRLDYRKLDVDISGAYDIGLSRLENATKLTVYEMVTNFKSGAQSLKVLKTITVTPRFDKAGNVIGNNAGGIIGLLLTAGTEYYISVEATGAATAKNTGYTLTIGGTQFDQANQVVDDDWKTSPVLEAIPGASVADEWVGFGDKLDYRKLVVDINGSYKLMLSKLENTTKLTLYTVNAKGALQSLKSVTISPRFDKAGNVTGNDTGALTGLLLTAGTEYYVSVEATGAATAKNTRYTLAVEGEQFDKANYEMDDVWNASPMLNAVPGQSVTNEWVGFGDKLDFRTLSVNVSGLYDLTLSGLENAAKLTLYTVNAKGTLQSLKSVTISPRFDKAGNVIGNSTGGLTGLLLTGRTEYFVSVEATGAATAKNTGYSLTVGGKRFENENNIIANNYWGDVGVEELDLASGLSGEWVGFGDSTDFFKFGLSSEQAGNYGFNLDLEVDKFASMTIYKVTPDKFGKDVLTQVKTSRDGTFQLGEGEYAVKVLSADNGKGVKNTGYDISIDLPDLEYWKLQSSLAQLGGTGDGFGLLESEINKGILA